MLHPRPTALDAFLRARKRFLACERIDMSSLAEELGVSRVTLYRWVGSREHLLVEVIWSLARRTLDNIEAEVTATGPSGWSRSSPASSTTSSPTPGCGAGWARRASRRCGC